jgi:isopenicillin-N N-acyltransferase-like protein
MRRARARRHLVKGHSMSITVAVTPLADPRRRGELFGSGYRDEIAVTDAAYRALFDSHDICPADVRRIAEESLAALTEWSPRLVDEIEGVAAGSSLPLWRVAALNARSEILATSTEGPSNECSTSVFVSVEGTPRTIQTWDWIATLQHSKAVWRYETDDIRGGTRTVTTFTEIGVLGKIGLNSGGLGLHFNLLQHDADGTRGAAQTAGVPVHLIARRILDEASTIDEAAAIAASARVSASVALTVVEHHDGADAAVLEVSPAGTVVLRTDDAGFVQHTNHFLDPGLATGDRLRAIDDDTAHRYDALVARRARLRGAEPADRAAALTMHDADGAGLCAHADLSQPLRLHWQTLATVCLDLEHGRMLVHDGTVCSSSLDDWLIV